jgi:hypothetical protein
MREPWAWEPGYPWPRTRGSRRGSGDGEARASGCRPSHTDLAHVGQTPYPEREASAPKDGPGQDCDEEKGGGVAGVMAPSAGPGRPATPSPPARPGIPPAASRPSASAARSSAAFARSRSATMASRSRAASATRISPVFARSRSASTSSRSRATSARSAAASAWVASRLPSARPALQDDRSATAC